MQINITIFIMHGYIERELLPRLVADLRIFPAVALLGPRQAGKPTPIGQGAFSSSDRPHEA